MFDIFFNSIFSNYEDRVVYHTELDGSTVVDTAYVNDGKLPYETAISCPKYNNGKWVIVEAYHTKDDARKGHNKWTGIMSSDNQPVKLEDCHNSWIISEMAEEWGVEEDTDFPAEF